MTTPLSVPGRFGGQQLDSLRRVNAATVLSHVRARETVSRSEIATAVGLSGSAITKIIAELERAGYITETVEQQPPPDRGRGRPRRPVTLDLRRHRFLAVHIGMQRTTVGMVDLSGNVVAIRHRQHRSTTPRAVMSTATHLIRQLIDQSGIDPDNVLGYGACTGGWVAHSTGVVRAFDELGWRDVPLAEGLAIEGLPLPRVDSTVRALALAEARLADATGSRNVLYLFIGNIIGCAHVVHGTITRGQHEAAGLIDHVNTGRPGLITCSCGRSDCLWAHISDAALTTAAGQRGLLPPGSTIEDLTAAARGQGEQAESVRRILRQRAHQVGITLASLIDIHDPDLAIIGGGELTASDEDFERLTEAANQRSVDGRKVAPIQPALIVGPAGLIRGASTPALDAFYGDPLAELK